MKFKGDVPDIKQTDMVWVVAVNSVGFGFCMFLAGPIERKIGSRLSILLASFLMRYVLNDQTWIILFSKGFSIGHYIYIYVCVCWINV